MSPRAQPTGALEARTFTVDDEHSGRRLDKFLRSQFKGVPAGLIFRLLRQGKLRVNGRKAKQDYRLTAGDVIDVPPLHVEKSSEVAGKPPIPLIAQIKDTAIYEDDDLLIINKPAGVAVHKGTDISAGVIEALRHLRPELPELELSHRLDRDTSGVLALAKTPSMLRYLHDLLRDREHEIERHYLAIVAGGWPSNLTALEAPLKRTEAEVVVHSKGQRAETHVGVRRRMGNRATLVDVRLLTGRKHQIRVHLRNAGHPIAGDDRYGDPQFNALVARRGSKGLHLHAARMVIPMPDKTELVVSAPMPESWDRLMKTGL